ncbi:MAG TPA: 4Fe-4S ferredoxin [Fibrobacteres bacterium]|jgi:ferredoxin|nr:4Fe-4S ferredoxin [Fibrobacterota bacterium]
MKTEIYYFTGTGNSLVVARDIAAQIEGELISIPSVIDQDTIQTAAKVIGIVFPVYMCGLPLIVKRFVKKIGNLQDRYIFAIATYGGMPGATINMLGKVIAKCGGKLAAGFTVCMPGNYTPMYGAIAEARQQQMFAAWHQKAPTIAEDIKANRQGVKENSNMLTNIIFSDIIYQLAASHIPKMDKQFRADEKCSRCGICQKVCPVNNIEMIDGKPAWKGHCEQCFACLQWCPEQAIQYGKNTTGRKRYHHPEVKISDLIK